MKNNTTIICLSYWPLFFREGMAGVELDAKTITQYQKEMQHGQDNSHATGCAWMQDNDTIHPALLFEQADAIHQHLLKWSENKPADWFTLDIITKDDTYALALMPQFEKTVKRFRLAYLIQNEKILPRTNINIMFCPLTFSSQGTSVINQVRHRIPPKCTIGFTTPEKFKNNDLNTPTIQNIKIRWNPPETTTYLQNQLYHD